MRVRSSFALATAFALAPMPLAARPQEPVVFRTTSELVVVRPVVFSSDGGPVTDLTVEDFKVTEQGEERPISIFIGPHSGPLEVALVVDASASMRQFPAREATTALLSRLHPGSCVLIVPFNDQVNRGVWGHPGDWWMRVKVAGLNLDGETALYDALLAAFHLMRTRAATQDRVEMPSDAGARELSFGDLMRFRAPGSMLGPGVEQPWGGCTIGQDPVLSTDPEGRVRRAIVVVSDGRDSISEATIEDVLLSAWGSSLPVFALAATEPNRRTRFTFTRRRPRTPAHLLALQRLAEFTGGIVIRATVRKSGTAFLDGFERLGQALRSHYVLGFVPAKADDPHAAVDRRSIKVSVRRRGFDVLAPSDLVLGRGASEGAALDLALRGFHELATGRAAQALATFDIAAALGPGLGLVHYGRGTALSLLQRPQDALAASRAAATLAPWLPDLNARIAELLAQEGDLDGAWEHALRAHRSGSEVLDLIDRLQHLAPREVDLTWPPPIPRIKLRAGGARSLLASFITPPVLAALGTAIAGSAHLSLSDGAKEGSSVLFLNVTRIQLRALKVGVRARLVLRDPTGQVLMDSSFSLLDARSSDERRAAAAAAVGEIERALAAPPLGAPRDPTGQRRLRLRGLVGSRARAHAVVRARG